MHHENVRDKIDEARRKGLTTIIHQNDFFGKDHAPGRDKFLVLEWNCFDRYENVSHKSARYSEGELVPIPVYWPRYV